LRVSSPRPPQLDQGQPRVYWRLTSDWLELTLRYLAPEHGTREIKDRINRTVLGEFDTANIELANTTVEIASVPTLHITEQRAES
jgi:hypothetical protein